jgi:hypothetical protein
MVTMQRPGDDQAERRASEMLRPLYRRTQTQAVGKVCLTSDRGLMSIRLGDHNRLGCALLGHISERTHDESHSPPSENYLVLAQRGSPAVEN